MNKEYTITLTEEEVVEVESAIRQTRDLCDAMMKPNTKSAAIADSVVIKLRALPIKYEFPRNGSWHRQTKEG